MSKRPTIQDLAEAAGVSSATVDRVLNGRTSVRRATAERVLLAADQIGYHAAGLLRLRADEALPRRRVCFLMQRSVDPFYQRLGQALIDACQYSSNIKLEPQLVYMDEVSPSFIAAKVRESSDYDAIALVTLDHSLITREIEALYLEGMPIFCLLSDISTKQYSGFIGWDSEKVGRTAAWTIHHLCHTPGKVGILLGSHRYLGQQRAETSFINYFRELGEAFTLLPSVLNLDDDRLAAESVSEMLSQHPDLVGIYSAGGGSKGMIETLRLEAAERNIICVCNELTDHSRLALRDGIIHLAIGTPIEQVASQAVKRMQSALAARELPPPVEIHLPAELYISENI